MYGNTQDNNIRSVSENVRDDIADVLQKLCCEMYIPEYERRDAPFVPRRLVIKLDLSKTVRAFDVVSEYKTDDKKEMRG